MVQYFCELGADVKPSCATAGNPPWTGQRRADAGQSRIVWFPRTVFAGRGWHLRSSHPALRGPVADPRCVPGAPEHQCGFGWPDRSGSRANARLRSASSPPTGKGVYQPAQQFTVIHTTRWPSGGPELPRLPEGHLVHRRRRDHGRASQGLSDPNFAPLEACSSTEVILTEHGHAMLQNFLNLYRNP